MRIIMMGTGPFAVPTFCALYDTCHTVAALVTAPLRFHRGKLVAPISCVRDVAAQHDTPIFDPEDVNQPEAQQALAALQPDLLVVCDYGQILSAATLAASCRGGINLHASLLPKYRGAAPIQWAILRGETETGVTVIHMTPQLDAGPCVTQMRVDIGPDETACALEARLAELGAQAVRQTLDAFTAGTIQALPQDPALACKAPRLKKTDGLIDWSLPAETVRNHVRAMTPWPASYTFWQRGDSPPVRLILGPVQVVDCPADAPPGTVVEAAAGRLVIAAGRSTDQKSPERRGVAPQTLQPAGKRWMAVEEFLRGHPLQVGDRFGGEGE